MVNADDFPEQLEDADCLKGSHDGVYPASVSAASEFEQHHRKEVVLNRLGLTESVLYQMMKNGEFPIGILISRQVRVWPESQILKWLEDRKAKDPMNREEEAA